MKKYVLLLSRYNTHPRQHSQQSEGQTSTPVLGFRGKTQPGNAALQVGLAPFAITTRGREIHPGRLERSYKGQSRSGCSRGGSQQQERCGSFRIGIVASSCPVKLPRRKRWEGSSRAARKCRSCCLSEPEHGVIYLASGGAKYRNRKINHGCVRYLPGGFLKLVYQ